MKLDKLHGYSLETSGLSHAANSNEAEKTVSYLSAPIEDTVSFSGLIPPLKLGDAAKTFINYLPEGEARACRVMTRIKDFAEGEAAGIGITAIGTGAVAPWPIAYNPIVNYKLKKTGATPEEVEEKHKTQKYSAWRQPVSAVLAIIFQLGVQKPIQKTLDFWTNNSKTAEIFNGTIYNQSFLNNEKYLERQVKKEYNTPEKIAAFNITYQEKDETGKKVKKTRPAKDVSEIVKQKISDQVDEIAKALKGIKEGDELIKVGDNIIPTKAIAESVNYQIEDYINFAKGLTKKHLEEYVKKAEQLDRNKDIVRNILDKDVIEQNISRITESNPKLNGNRIGALREYLTEQQKGFEKAGNDDMVKILDRILGKCDKVIENSCARTIERIKKISDACGGTFSPGAYFDYMYSKRNVIANTKAEALEKLLIPEAQWETITPSELQARIEKIIDACHYDAKDKTSKQVFKDKGVFLSNKGELREFVYRNIIEKGYKEVVKHKNKVSSQVVKACIATFIMLPITCTALNWVYPRFMDIFLPSLSGKKDKVASAENNGGAN